MTFDPTQFGATPINNNSSETSFDASKFGATPINNDNNSSFDPRDVILDHQKTQTNAPKVGNFLSNASNIADKILGFGSNISGIKTAVDLVGTAGEGFQYAANKALGNDKANKQLLANPQSESMKKANIEGTEAGVKDVSGKTLETGMNAALLMGGGPLEGGLVKQVGKGAAIGYGYDVAQNLQNNKQGLDIIKPGAGTVVGGVLPIVTKVGGAILKRLTGVTSGAGKDVIQRALDNPDDVNAAIGKYASTPEEKQALVETAQNKVKEYLSNRSNEYSQSINTLTPNKEIPFDTAINSFENNIKDFGGNIKNGKLSFTDSKLTNTEQGNLKSVWDNINNWKDLDTVKGWDDMRQAVGNYIKEFKMTGNPTTNVILGNVQKDLKNQLIKSVPGYDKMLSSYGNKTELAKNILKELNLNSGAAKESTQLNSLMRIFKKDPSIIKNLSETMSKKEVNSFLNEISGAILSDWIPQGKVGNVLRGTAEVGAAGATAAHIPGALPVLVGGAAISSPRLVGESSAIIGKSIQKGVGKGARAIITKSASKLKK